MDLFSGLRRLVDLDAEIERIETTLKTIKKEFSEVESFCVKEMESNEIDSIKVGGVQFSPALPAFKIAGDEAEAFEWLKKEGYAEAVKQSKETINHQTLSKILRERMEETGIESIPAELFACVNTGKLKLKR